MENYRKNLRKARDYILENDEFLVVSHLNPDGDTISSSLAICNILKQLGKSFTVVNENVLPKKFDFIPLFSEFKILTQQQDKKYANIITLDVADYSRAGNINNILNEQAIILNIDHHPTNDHFGNINVIQPTAASTTEVIFDLIKVMNIELNKDLATAIYTGILTDTGGFRYSNTTSKTMKIAAELLEYDINPGKIAEKSLETITKGFIIILKIALERIEIIEDGLISWTFINYDDLNHKFINDDDVEGIVNYTRNIEGVEVGIFFKRNSDGIIKVSLRSKDFLDVSDIAKSFGGGGHAKAAGFSYSGSLEILKEELLSKIKKSKGWSKIGK